jgi:hypothetical protein
LILARIDEFRGYYKKYNVLTLFVAKRLILPHVFCAFKSHVIFTETPYLDRFTVGFEFAAAVCGKATEICDRCVGDILPHRSYRAHE